MYKEMIMQNKLKSYIYMTLLMMIFGTLGIFISDRLELGLSGTSVFLIVSIIINITAYFFSDRIILRSAKATLIEQSDSPELYEIITELTTTAEIPMPKVYLINDKAINAFATGRNPSHGAVAVTKGMIEKLTPTEIKAVLAHEITHIGSYDILFMTIISVIAGFISILSDMYWRSSLITAASSKDRSGISSLIGVFLVLFAPLTALIIQLSISRKREFVADAGAAQLLGESQSLISALEKISRDRRKMHSMSASAAHLCFNMPTYNSDFLDKIFSTHPPIEVRIAKLREFEK